MISRLMLSLKKASRAKEIGWTSDALSRAHAGTVTQIEFGDPPNGPNDTGGTTSDEVALSNIGNRRVSRGSGEGTVR